MLRNGAGDLGNEPGNNLLGIAWSKQATYLPEIAHNFNGWTTSIMVRNESPQSQPLRVVFYNLAPTGVPVFEYNTTLNAGQGWEFSPPGDLRGSAIVNGSEDLAVSGALRRYSNFTYSGASYAGVPFTNTTGPVYVPLVMRKMLTASGPTNSDLYIQNTGSSALSAVIELVGLPGYSNWNYTKPSFNVPPGAAYLYSLESESSANVPENWIGSAKVSVTGGPNNVAILSDLKSGAAIVQSLQGFSAVQATSNWNIPLFSSRLANGLNTPVTVQNLSGGQFNAYSISLACTPLGSGSTFTVWNSQPAPNNGSY